MHCSRSQGLRIKVCINLNWRFTAAANAVPYSRAEQSGGNLLVERGWSCAAGVGKRIGPKTKKAIEWSIKEMRRAATAIGSFFSSPKLVDKKHFVTLKKLRENKNVDSKKLMDAFYSSEKTTNGLDGLVTERGKYLSSILKKSKARHQKYLSDKKCDSLSNGYLP